MSPVYQDFHSGNNQRQIPNSQNNPAGFLMAAIQEAQNIMRSGVNPQQYALQQLTGIPPFIQNDPDQIIRYLEQNHRLNQNQQMLLSYIKGQ